MNLTDAKQLLKSNGYKLIKEGYDYKMTGWTTDAIFSKMYKKCYSRWANCTVDVLDLQFAFKTGFNDNVNIDDYCANYCKDYSGKNIVYIKRVFRDGRNFGRCRTAEEIATEFIDRIDLEGEDYL